VTRPPAAIIGIVPAMNQVWAAPELTIHTVAYGSAFWGSPGIESAMALTQTPRGNWIDEGLRALGRGGPEAVRIESLARALGVSKGGFYWHFDDRQALLEEMLDAWERTGVDEVIEAVEADEGDARARLRRLFALASASGGELLRIELAIRDWARRDRAVARRLRRVDNRRMEYMRSLFGAICEDEDDVEARCMLAFSLSIGAPFVSADHGGRSRAEVLDLALARLVAWDRA
jgi:AcrR family transcriptional regulator